MSVRRKHESLPPRLILKRRFQIEEINIEARKHREEGINGALRLHISFKSLFLRARLSNDDLI